MTSELRKACSISSTKVTGYGWAWRKIIASAYFLKIYLLIICTPPGEEGLLSPFLFVRSNTAAVSTTTTLAEDALTPRRAAPLMTGHQDICCIGKNKGALSLSF